MNKIEIDASTDHTGSIRIRLPTAPAHHPVHVVVEWEEAPDAGGGGWPPGWFEATAGSIDDPTFVRAPQGTHEDRRRTLPDSRSSSFPSARCPSMTRPRRQRPRSARRSNEQAHRSVPMTSSSVASRSCTVLPSSQRTRASSHGSRDCPSKTGLPDDHACPCSSPGRPAAPTHHRPPPGRTRRLGRRAVVQTPTLVNRMQTSTTLSPPSPRRPPARP